MRADIGDDGGGGGDATLIMRADMSAGMTRGPATKAALLLLFALLGTRPEAALGFGKYLSQQKSLAKQEEEGGAGVVVADGQQVTRDSRGRSCKSSLAQQTRTSQQKAHKKFWQAIKVLTSDSQKGFCFLFRRQMHWSVLVFLNQFEAKPVLNSQTKLRIAVL